MYEDLIGIKAFVDIGGTQYHGKVVGTGQYKEGWMCELEIPIMGILYVKPEHLEIRKERTNDKRLAGVIE